MRTSRADVADTAVKNLQNRLFRDRQTGKINDAEYAQLEPKLTELQSRLSAAKAGGLTTAEFNDIMTSTVSESVSGLSKLMAEFATNDDILRNPADPDFKPVPAEHTTRAEVMDSVIANIGTRLAAGFEDGSLTFKELAGKGGLDKEFDALKAELLRAKKNGISETEYESLITKLTALDQKIYAERHDAEGRDLSVPAAAGTAPVPAAGVALP